MATGSKSSVIFDDISVEDELGNQDDRRDMMRMGKAQQLRVSALFQKAILHSWLLTSMKRNFGFASIFGFSMIIQQSWEVILRFVHATSFKFHQRAHLGIEILV